MKKLFIYLINIPLYYFSYFIKKDPSLWIFGAWAGKKYADNSKYFFEYMNKEHPEIKSVWITKNKKVYESLLKQGVKVEYAYSWNGYLLSMKAKVAIISNTKLGDMNGFVLNKRTILVQLWHGNPMKKIGYDSIFQANYRQNESLYWLFPYLESDYSLFSLTSEKTKSYFNTAFKVDLDKFVITGYSRNDNLLNSKSTSDKKKIIYMPTYRETLEEELTLVSDFNKTSFDIFLSDNNLLFYVKLHPNSKLNDYFEKVSTKNIEILEVEDIYDSLASFDLLITDYSSIYFDFLILNRPVILAPFDLEYYSSTRGIYQDYLKDFNDNIAYNWSEIKINIFKLLIKNEDLFDDARKSNRIIYNKFNDNLSSKRIYNEIINLYNKGCTSD